MGRKKSAGLYKEGDYYRIDKVIRGHRIRESTGTSSLDEAERYLAQRVSEVRGALIYGKRQTYTFADAAAKYLKENMNLKSIADDASRIRGLLPFIGNMPLSDICNETMQPYVEDLREKGRKSKTINNGLELVRRILKEAASTWQDELSKKTWLASMPVIKSVKWKDARTPYPISHTEQKLLLVELVDHLAEPALFALHTGCREQEVCQLKWDWEMHAPQLGRSAFVLPASITKNEEERIVVLNSVAKSVVDSQRGKHPARVFTRPEKKGEYVPLKHIYGHGWQGARERAADKYEQEMKDSAPWGFRHLRVHDLRHTFGKRLRAVDVSKETRSDLLGHKTGDITSHYSAAELKELFDAVDKLAENNSPDSPQLTLVRAVAQK
jgi:integrase